MSVSGLGGSGTAQAMQGAMRTHRPNVTELASNAFAKLDTGGKGYIDKSDLTSALASTGSSSSSAEQLMSALDGDQDGKVTRQELTDTLQKVADQLEAGFSASRVSQAAGGRPSGPPPGPPPGVGQDDGMTADQLGSMASDAAASGSSDASELQALVNSFDAADTDGDGKVSFKEAMAFRESTASETGAAAGTSDGSSGTTNDRMLARVLDMLAQYNASATTSQAASTLSVSA